MNTIELGQHVHYYDDDHAVTVTMIGSVRAFDTLGLERFEVSIEIGQDGERLIVPCGIPDEMTVEQAYAVAAALTLAAQE